MDEIEGQKAKPEEMLSDEQRRLANEDAKKPSRWPSWMRWRRNNSSVNTNPVPQDPGGLASEDEVSLSEETHDTPESEEVEVNELERSPEEIAKGKLQELLSGDVSEYALRFMNIEEYQQILAKHWIRGEVVPRCGKFLDYIERNKGDWKKTALEQTDWDFSVTGMENYRFLLDLLKECRKSKSKREALEDFSTKVIEAASEKQPGYYTDMKGRFPILEKAAHYNTIIENIRTCGTELVQLLSESWKNAMKIEIDKFMESENDDGKNISILNQRIQDEYHARCYAARRSIPYSSGQESEIRIAEAEYEAIKLKYKPLLEGSYKLSEALTKIDSFGRARLSRLHSFLNDPEFVQSDGNLRVVFNDLVYGPRATQVEIGRHNPYHILVAFREESRKVAKGFIVPWGRIDTYQATGDEILAAVAVMPNKELYQQMIGLSSHSGNFAHPIFDSNGTVRFPLSEKTDENASTEGIAIDPNSIADNG